MLMLQATELTETVLADETPDFSILGMFLQADIVVQIVMIMLLVASVWGWTIIYSKFMRMRQANALADDFEDTFWSGNSLEDLYDGMRSRPSHPLDWCLLLRCASGVARWPEDTRLQTVLDCRTGCTK